MLCTAGCSPDDGSLHEATREMHLKVVISLLGAGHRPNFPSPNHGYRTAIYEFLLNGVPVPARRQDIGRIISTLAKADADLKIRLEGKAAIFLALDDTAAVEIVAALLETDVGKHLRSDDNLFVDPE